MQFMGHKRRVQCKQCSTIAARDTEIVKLKEDAGLLRGQLCHHLLKTDSYGVPDSEWFVCTVCGAEDRPGIFAKGVPHKADCILNEAVFPCEAIEAVYSRADSLEEERDQLKAEVARLTEFGDVEKLSGQVERLKDAHCAACETIEKISKAAGWDDYGSTLWDFVASLRRERDQQSQQLADSEAKRREITELAKGYKIELAENLEQSALVERLREFLKEIHRFLPSHGTWADGGIERYYELLEAQPTDALKAHDLALAEQLKVVILRAKFAPCHYVPRDTCRESIHDWENRAIDIAIRRELEGK